MKILPKFQQFDQILVQNSSLDDITALISKQQSKSSLKAIHESKIELKIKNLIKNTNLRKNLSATSFLIKF